MGKSPLILLPAVFSMPDGSHVNYTVLGQCQSAPVLTHRFSSALLHLHVAFADCSGHQHPWGSCSAPLWTWLSCFSRVPGASVAVTCVFCPVPEVVRGKLIHHGDVRVFVGSSYRKLMDHEIIQRKKKKKERVRANCTASTTCSSQAA